MLSQSLRQQLASAAENKDWARAIAVCERALLAGEDAWLLAVLGRALVRVGRPDEAIAAYTRSIALQPAQPKLHCALGELYDRQQKLIPALSHYQSALRLVPHWTNASLALGKLFHRLGDATQALATYEGILRRDQSCAEALFSVGLVYEQKGDYALAIRRYRDAVFAAPSYAVAYRHLGAALTRLGQLAAAVEVYSQAIDACPNNALLYSGLGQVQLAQGDSMAAATAYQKALEIDPNLAIAHHNLGRLCYRYQSPAQAVEHFGRSLTLAPDNLAMLSDYAWTLTELGDWDKLLSCFSQAIAQQSDFIEAYCRRAIAPLGKHLPGDDLLCSLQRTCAQLLLGIQRGGDLPAAVPILKRRMAEVYEHMGRLSIACNALPRAEQCYQFALSLVPTAWACYEQLGDCLLAQGRQLSAIALYQAGLLQLKLASESSQVDHQAGHQVGPVANASQKQRLQTKLQQALSADGAVPAIAVKGVYRYAKDWLAERASATTAEAPVPTEAVSPPDPACGSVTCHSCMRELIRQFAPVQVSKSAFKCTAGTGFDFSTFTVTLPNGRAWIAPQRDAWDVCDEIAIFSEDDFLLGDVSRCFPWHLPGCQRHDVTHHIVLQRRSPLPKVRSLPGKVAILSGLSGHIYYHWLFDVLPRLGVLQRDLSKEGRSLADIDTFVVNSVQKPFQRETLRMLNIPVEKVIESDRVPHIQAQQLVVPSFAGHLDWVPPDTMDYLRRVFLPRDPHQIEPGARIYISRAKARYRQVFNEAEVIALLGRFGFRTVSLEMMSVAEQASLFATAEAVVAPHGSGLANLVFCSAGAKVIEFFSPQYLRTDYWMISQYLRLHHYYLLGESLAFKPLRQLMYPSGLTEDFSVDIVALRSLLQQAGLVI